MVLLIPDSRATPRSAMMRKLSGLFCLLMILLVGCSAQRRKSDAELGLNEQQARGRRVYDAKCARCHEPYSRSSQKGPSLARMYKKPYLPSGIPVTDEHVADVTVRGRRMMPGFATEINQQQLQDLIAYMKTL